MKLKEKIQIGSMAFYNINLTVKKTEIITIYYKI
jgi:hypothetical protein